MMNTNPPAPGTLTIDTAAIRSNIRAIRRRVGESTRFLAVIKARAYGTDALGIAQALSDDLVDAFGVAYLGEALELRRSGVRKTILLLNFTPEEAGLAVRYQIDVTVSDANAIEALAIAAREQGRVAQVHLYVDSGMGRLACRPEEALALAQRISQHSSLALMGLMTHPCCADDPSQDAFTLQQIDIFDRCLQTLEASGIRPKLRHFCNSAAAARFSVPQANMVRVGLAMHGVYTSPAVEEMDLTLALSLSSRIIGVSHLPPGATVGYGCKFRAPAEGARIATLALGYHDGLHRSHSGRSWVSLNGALVPFVGMISMDSSTIDVSHLPGIGVGDPVKLFGLSGMRPETLAVNGGTIPHEFLSCLGPRIQRLVN